MCGRQLKNWLVKRDSYYNFAGIMADWEVSWPTGQSLIKLI